MSQFCGCVLNAGCVVEAEGNHQVQPVCSDGFTQGTASKVTQSPETLSLTLSLRLHLSSVARAAPVVLLEDPADPADPGGPAVWRVCVRDKQPEVSGCVSFFFVCFVFF